MELEIIEFLSAPILQSSLIALQKRALTEREVKVNHREQLPNEDFHKKNQVLQGVLISQMCVGSSLLCFEKESLYSVMSAYVHFTFTFILLHIIKASLGLHGPHGHRPYKIG